MPAEDAFREPDPTTSTLPIHPVPLQVSGAFGVVFAVVALVLDLLVLFGVGGGLGVFYLRFRREGTIGERLNRMERKIGRLEAQVEAPRESDG